MEKTTKSILTITLLCIIAFLGIIFAMKCVQDYLDKSQRSTGGKVAAVMETLGKVIVKRNASDETISKMTGKPVLSREIIQSIKAGDAAAVTQALDQGLEINTRDYMVGMTMLHHAAAEGQLDIARLLVERGAGVNAMDEDRNTPLHFAAYRPGNIAVLKYLLDHGAKRDLVDDEGLTPLGYAQQAGDREMAAALQ